MKQHSTAIDDSDPGQNVTLRFALICTLLLLSAVWLEPHLGPLNRATAFLSGKTLALFGYEPQVRGDLIALAGFTVRIVSECTSLHATLLLTAFILAWPATWHHRLAGIAAGSGMIGFANLLRIAGVTVIGAHDRFRFEIFHVYLGQMMMLLLVVGCCMVWRSWCSGERGALSFMFRAVCWGTVLFLPWLKINKVYIALIDKLFEFIYAIFHPEIVFHITLPLLIYNHAFEAPLYLALVLASSAVPLRRRVVGAICGLLVIAGWHTLFRFTHVVWTAFGVEEFRVLLFIVYYLGQYLLPFFLWLLVVAWRPSIPRRFFTKMNNLTPMLILLLIVTGPKLAGAVMLIIEPAGRGSYNLRIEGLKKGGVTGGDIRINYESGSRTLPTVRPGEVVSPQQLRAATDFPGVIDITLSLDKPLSAGGNLAFIELSGRITSLSGFLQIDGWGSVSPSTRITNYPEEKKLPEATSQPQSARKNGSDAVEQVVPVSPELVTSSRPAYDQSSASTIRLDGSIPFRRLEGALERYCSGQAGELNRDALNRIFAPVGNGEFSQDPPLILTDGSAEMRVTFRLKREREMVKCFLIKGAKCTSLRDVGPGEWLLVLEPEQGVLSASVAVLTTMEMVEYPLTVAPPLPLSASSPEDGEPPCRREFVSVANRRAARE